MGRNQQKDEPVIPHINAMGTAVPDNDQHQYYISWAKNKLPRHKHNIFSRMAKQSGIEHRWSVLADWRDYYDAPCLPGTASRMARYAEHAPQLASKAVRALGNSFIPEQISHIVVASCTGFVAPGIDQMLLKTLGLRDSTERLLVGFMGCYAAVIALRNARHIVRSDPAACVLVVTVELSSLHLTETEDIESLLAMLQFGDGAAAAIVSARSEGIALGRSFSAGITDTGDLITWTIGDQGFLMNLSGRVPGIIATTLADPTFRNKITQDCPINDVTHWAVHAGGRSILDAVERGLALSPGSLNVSRDVLRDRGNMSSATLMFVLERLYHKRLKGHGVALAFGPGMAVEGFMFGGPA